MFTVNNVKYPERIVCLTEETTEALYLMGEQDRIVGISGYTMRPPEARKEKPKVSAFTSAKMDKILDLQPDLILGFSDMQAEIANTLIRAGKQVHVFNQRSVTGIFEMIQTLGGLIGEPEKARRLNEGFMNNLEQIQLKASKLKRKPRVYFEEWNDPLISGIGWVSDLIEIAGGIDCYREFARNAAGKDRIIHDHSQVIEKAPDIIIGSWCGRKFRPEQLKAREGWDVIPAVQTGQLHEIKSVYILQPGPACLTEGVEQLHQIISDWEQTHG